MVVCVEKRRVRNKGVKKGCGDGVGCGSHMTMHYARWLRAQGAVENTKKERWRGKTAALSLRFFA